MRTVEFFKRLLFLVPLAFWGTFMFLVLIGIVANLLGAGPLFYCNVYCKISVFLMILLISAIVYCQAKSCYKLR